MTAAGRVIERLFIASLAAIDTFFDTLLPSRHVDGPDEVDP